MLVALWAAAACTACTTVPELEEDGVAVSAIVQRVKCEIAYALPEPQPPYPTGRYQWMRDWTAKVDLTLITNNQSSLTPSVSITHPMIPSVLPGIGSFGQSFGISAGAGVTTTAIRNASLSFTLSAKDLRAQRRNLACDPVNAQNLYGYLGLKEWVASALTPVEFRQLTMGRHPPPNGKSAPAPLIPTAGDRTPEKELELRKALVEYWSSEAIKNAKAVARNSETAVSGMEVRNVQAAYDAAYLVNQTASNSAKEFAKAQKAYNAAKQIAPDDKKLDTMLAGAKAANDEAVNAKQETAAMIEGIPHDPPIDSIGHQVQFVVMSNANVTPNWSLVRFKGPGNAGSLLSATRTNTHTLIIALGAPAAPGSAKAGEEQLRQLQNLHLEALRTPLGQ